MEWLVVFLFIVAIAAAIGIGYYLESMRLKKKRQRIENRPRLSPKDIYDEFYKEALVDETCFLDLWMKVADTMKLDPEKLRPTDRFDVELAPIEGSLSEDEVVDLNEFFEKECARRGIDTTNVQVKTIDDFIRLLSQIKTINNLEGSEGSTPDGVLPKSSEPNDKPNK